MVTWADGCMWSTDLFPCSFRVKCQSGAPLLLLCLSLIIVPVILQLTAHVLQGRAKGLWKAWKGGSCTHPPSSIMALHITPRATLQSPPSSPPFLNPCLLSWIFEQRYQPPEGTLCSVFLTLTHVALKYIYLLCISSSLAVFVTRYWWKHSGDVRTWCCGPTHCLLWVTGIIHWNSSFLFRERMALYAEMAVWQFRGTAHPLL